jgi:hypothetical protein
LSFGQDGIVFIIPETQRDRKIFIERGAFSPRLVKGRAIVHRGRSKATDTKKDRGKFARTGSETPPGVRET